MYLFSVGGHLGKPLSPPNGSRDRVKYASVLCPSHLMERRNPKRLYAPFGNRGSPPSKIKLSGTVSPPRWTKHNLTTKRKTHFTVGGFLWRFFSLSAEPGLPVVVCPFFHPALMRVFQEQVISVSFFVLVSLAR